MLEEHNVDLVLDVGANVGQFAQSMRSSGYRGRLVSFEPLSSAHAQLLRNSHRDQCWQIAPRAALGDHEDEIDIRIAGNSVSSSVLAVLTSHENAAPESRFVGNERVRLTQLDSIVGEYLQADSVPFLKIDVQGYEDRVLDGAKNFLNVAIGLHLELSLVPLYEGQQLFQPLVDRLRRIGFSIWAIWPGLHDLQSGRMLQVDATFFRD
jgi:FkbM family methyltransferase